MRGAGMAYLKSTEVLTERFHIQILVGVVGESRVNFVCYLVFSIHSTSLLQQWRVKEPSHSA